MKFLIQEMCIMHEQKINLKIIFKLTVPLVINILSAYYLWTYKLRKFYHENFFLKEKSLNLKILG